jgi:hypothetical protein
MFIALSDQEVFLFFNAMMFLTLPKQVSLTLLVVRTSGKLKVPVPDPGKFRLFA